MVNPDLWSQTEDLLTLANMAQQQGESGPAIHYFAGSLIARAGFRLAGGEQFATYPTANGNLQVPVRVLAQVSMPKIFGEHVRNVRVNQLGVAGWDRVFQVIEHYNMGNAELISVARDNDDGDMQLHTAMTSSPLAVIANFLERDDITSEPIMSRVLSVAANDGKPAEWPVPDQMQPFRDGLRGAMQFYGCLLAGIIEGDN